MSNDQDATVLAQDLRTVVGQLARRLRSEVSSTGLTWSQESVIQRLANSDGMTSAELARAEGVRPQSMSATVAVLEADGLIAGADDPADGRRTVLTLTAAGRDARARAQAMKQRWLSSVLAKEFSAAERSELRSAVDLLTRIAQH